MRKALCQTPLHSELTGWLGMEPTRVSLGLNSEKFVKRDAFLQKKSSVWIDGLQQDFSVSLSIWGNAHRGNKHIPQKNIKQGTITQ